jgi:hypothetical protein
LLARKLAAASRARNDLRPVLDLWTILSDQANNDVMLLLGGRSSEGVWS